jgi:hypothetical protein
VSSAVGGLISVEFESRVSMGWKWAVANAWVAVRKCSQLAGVHGRCPAGCVSSRWENALFVQSCWVSFKDSLFVSSETLRLAQRHLHLCVGFDVPGPPVVLIVYVCWSSWVCQADALSAVAFTTCC